ncbi:MAG TPA: hypothetical protein VH854_00035 [Thermoanaerobaculia bacterium]|jgi:hypothetical protein|nr:hypothetical protein [Thermoanaerobaculia bacterium]
MPTPWTRFRTHPAAALSAAGLIAALGTGSTTNVESSRKQRDGRLRAGSPELAGTFRGEGDVEPLTAFLRSLNEDYN